MIGRELVLLALAIVLFAGWMVAHLATLMAVLRSNLDAKWKWLSLVPPITPIAAWRANRRKTVAVWSVFLVAYTTVRWVGG